MSEQDRNTWDKRYAEDSYQKNNPVTLLEAWLPRFPVGKALDVACGPGRNAIRMARAGFRVDAIDISLEGLKKAKQEAESQGLHIHWIEHDLDLSYRFATDYSLIVVMWYVNLPLITQLCQCLAPGGYLLCQEHLITDQPVIGPRNPGFRVAPGELRKAVAGLDIVLYEESIDTLPAGDRVASARLIARHR